MSMFVYRGELLLGAKDCISSGVQTEFSCVVILFVFAKLGHTCFIPLKTVRHQVCLEHFISE